MSRERGTAPGRPRPGSPASTSRKGAGGYTLIELSFVITVLMGAMLSMSRTIVGAMRLNETHRETALATDAVRQTIETIQGVEQFEELFALYNDDPLDDLGFAGSAPGSAFDVPGLAAAAGDPDGRVGEIVLPVRPGAFGPELREDVVDAALGMPRDLNGDGVLDRLDHSGDFRILPVLVRVRWQGAGGPRTVEVATLVADL